MTKSTQSKPTPINVLQQRVERLRAELQGVADVITEVERSRDAEVLLAKEKVTAAELEHERRLRRRDSELSSIEAKEKQARALISSGEKLLAEMRESRVETEKMDLGGVDIVMAKQGLQRTLKDWAGKLAEVQNSATRRKRSQLQGDIEKLERRMSRKAAEPVRTGVVSIQPGGESYGTPKPKDMTTPGVPCREVPAEQLAAG